QGQEVVETDEVELGEVARRAWDNVETDGANLCIESDGKIEVEADENRLLQVFENLFRNSVEHGSTNSSTGSNDCVEDKHNDGGITVRVGVTDGGFYVEDTGDGIPEDERGSIFDSGYTTSSGGTGLGLSIVEQIVEAHGWEIQVGESEEGGARFEITFGGVEEE
ncbi:MAG: HAMP domain-containing sensor histidine kinase, partial [Halobacteria archaeon]|nr:HAMP domain-containing sensor histidine kinase [Halobacteria archaeon]